MLVPKNLARNISRTNKKATFNSEKKLTAKDDFMILDNAFPLKFFIIIDNCH